MAPFKESEPKMDEIIGGWKILHNESLCNLNSSPYISGTIKSRRRCAGQVVRKVEEFIQGFSRKM
jgi:hypothetical protein